jgi:hypothetical protein
MALSEDSRSLLQLLLARGKSYDDIAGLLGVDRTEVQRRANAALTEINGSDPDARAGLTDYLLGQADPIARADTARTLAEDPEALETATSISDQLRLLVPGANLPDLSPSVASVASSRKASAPKGESASKAEPAEGETEAAPGFPGRRLNGSQTKLLAVLVVAAVLVALIVVLIGALGGDDDEKDTTASRPAPTTAVLRPVDSETGQGEVEFGFAGTSLAANLQFSDLEPSSAGNSYTLWLFGPGGSFPLHQTRVTDSGAIAGQIAVNEAIICFIAGDLFPDMRLSRVTNPEMRQTLRDARDGNGGGARGGLPEFVGDLVLEGPISMPQDAKDQILRTCNGPQ